MRNERIIWMALVGLALAGRMPAAADTFLKSGVVVEDHGGSVTLKNSEIDIQITKSNLRVTSLRKRGAHQGVNLLQGGMGYYFLNYVVGADRRVFTPGSHGSMSYQLIHAGPERAEIALSFNDPSKLPFHFEYHVVLLADEPGFYIYSIFRYPEGMPDGAALEQSRFSFRANPALFTHYGIEEDSVGDRFGRFPRSSELTSQQSIFDATWKLVNTLAPETLAEDIYTKYEHSVFMGDNSIFSLFGTDIGMHLIRPSDEYLVGGPEKQEYFTEMTTTTPMLHFYEQVRHYGVPNVVPQKGWEKLYGPFFVYLNECRGIGDMWQDAKARSTREKAAWPYEWLVDPLYKATERSVVEGRLILTDGTSAKGAWVILGHPDLPAFEQNLDYLYYVRAAKDGTFAIPHVRPGAYTLYAHVDGVPGEFRHDGIVAGTNETVNTGVLEWTPPNHGQTLWQIGSFNRRPDEFRNGDRLRNWGLWLLYPLEFPEGVDFHVGTSAVSEDWNYFQPAFRTPGAASHLFVPQDLTPAPWNIRFDLDAAQSGSGTLTIAVAGATFAGLEVSLNGTVIADYTQSGIPPRTGPRYNDASVYRCGAAGIYSYLLIPFDAALLEAAENTVTLLVTSMLDDGNRVYASVMYDAIRMEVDSGTPYQPPLRFLQDEQSTTTDGRK